MDKTANRAQILAARYDSRIPALREMIESAKYGAIRAYTDENGINLGKSIASLTTFTLSLEAAEQLSNQVKYVAAQYQLIKTRQVEPTQELKDAVSTLNVLSFTQNGQELQKFMVDVRKVITPAKSIKVSHAVRHFFDVDPIELDDMAAVVMRLVEENSWDVTLCATLLDTFDPGLSARLKLSQ